LKKFFHHNLAWGRRARKRKGARPVSDIEVGNQTKRAVGEKGAKRARRKTFANSALNPRGPGEGVTIPTRKTSPSCACGLRDHLLRRGGHHFENGLEHQKGLRKSSVLTSNETAQTLGPDRRNKSESLKAEKKPPQH